MNIEIVDDDDDNEVVLTPRLLGFCIGVPGAPCGRRIYDDEIEAVELERRYFPPHVRNNPKVKNPVIGKCCYSRLFPLVSSKPQTASQIVSLKKKAGKVSAKVDNNRVRIRKGSERRVRREKTKPNGIRLPGSVDFADEKQPGPPEWRQYGGSK